MKVKEETKKVGLKLNIQKTKIMASGPITSWEIDGDSLPMGFLRQEYWSGLPFPTPGDFPNLGLELWSPELQADPLRSEL